MKHQKQQQKIIYTPDDEPYLGRQSVHELDKLIITALEMSCETAKQTHEVDRSDLQNAACQLIPQGISLVLSIRELIRQGYLFGALVLLRPLAERTVTIHYLLRFAGSLPIWTAGWKYNERPKLPTMINQLAQGGPFEKTGRSLADKMNSITHGDPESSIFNVVELPDGKLGYATSKLLDNPNLCDKVAADASSFLIMLIAANTVIFPPK